MSELQSRAAVIELHANDDAPPAIRAALSSDEPVPVGGVREVLQHTAEAIDFSRAEGGLPLTVGHSEMDPLSSELPIGRVTGIRLDADGRLRGDLEFDTDERAIEVRGKVERGVARDLSMTYKVETRAPLKNGISEVTRWQPRAVSIVTMPADHHVGIGRSDNLETEATMPDETTQPEAGSASTDILATVRERAGAGYQRGAEDAAARINAINAEAANLGRALPQLSGELEELRAYAVGESTVTADQFRSLALELIGGAGHPLTVEGVAARAAGNVGAVTREPSVSVGGEPPVSRLTSPGMPGPTRRPIVQPGTDERENVARGVEMALLERIGTVEDEAAAASNKFRGWPVSDMQREILEAHGTDTRGMSRKSIAQAAIAMRAISPGTAQYQTSDFPSVTANVLTKRVNAAFQAAEVTWNRFCSTIEVPDFKQFHIPRLSQINSLPVVLENAAYQPLTQTDEREEQTLVKRGGLISWSWEAMTNDDAGMLMRTADRLGEAAARTLDENAYGVLTANANMRDGNALFSAPHSNTGTDALDFDGIVATRTRMARQTDDNSELLGVVMRFVLVPEELRETANQLAGAEYLPKYERDTTGTATDMAIAGAQMVNSLRGTFEVVASVRLTDTNDWYAQGAIGQGIEIAFLAGNRNPAIERESGWDTDAVHYKVRHPSIAYPIDWRGLQRNVVAG